jgi:hypothetical protein
MLIAASPAHDVDQVIYPLIHAPAVEAPGVTHIKYRVVT